jgi:hypothetical protein
MYQTPLLPCGLPGVTPSLYAVIGWLNCHCLALLRDLRSNLAFIPVIPRRSFCQNGSVALGHLRVAADDGELEGVRVAVVQRAGEGADVEACGRGQGTP